MRALFFALVMAVSPTAQAFDFSKIFLPPKKKIVQSKPRHIPSRKHKHDHARKFIVGPEWISRYFALVEIWNYPLPEDALIRYSDGNYIVPPVVFRHYEDMSRAER